ncbi:MULTISPECIES: heavy-metal-associated domain-containing protein [Phaeodactylibacter]|mgnify:CR=1 FL=1|jgi:copper chaperone CopZ|uniref:Heavy-metal-associated domain-containing protein n=1 Tax=Phaeodactylibacter luteus TaxID=1564516 RepID=A0A5C6RJ31_9BACT|nr:MULTISPECIES: heavy metal-associated domain-containing protein [Phaeodactylibacter]TXB62311.1 heavy-metal-associated domain-containing protein [Phaeodactylibacter luteus]
MNNLKFFFTAALLLFFTVGAYSQSCHGNKADNSSAEKIQTVDTDADLASATFRVSGNCGMCKRTIEGAATSLAGVHTATWDQDAKVITITYVAETTTLLQIKEKIAASGYDTESVRANDQAYQALHGCCQYDRVKL